MALAKSSTVVGSSLRLAVDDFIMDRKVSGFTARTVTHYNATFDKFLPWIESNLPEVKGVGEITDKVIIRWMTSLSDAGLSPRTIYGFQVDLKAWFNWLVSDGQIDANPFGDVRSKKVRMVKLPTLEPDHYSTEEWAALEAATSGKDAISVRNRALIYFLLDSCLRLESVVGLTVGQVDLTLGVVNRVKLKGQKEGSAYLSPTTIQAMRRYMRFHPSADDPNAKLWLSNRGENGASGNMTYYGLSTILRKLGRRAKYSKDGIKRTVQCSAHKFRRTAAINALRSGMSIFEVQRLLHHEDIQVLKHYVKFLESDIKKAHEERGPLKFFKRG